MEVPLQRLRLADTIDGVINNSYMGKSHVFGSRDKYQISKAMESAGIPIPTTMTVEEYLDSAERLLPAVLKERNGTLGKGVYYIDRPDLIERFFVEETYSRTPGKTPRKRKYLVQQFIHAPGGFFNHYRVFTVGGEILGCVLNVRMAVKESEDAARETRSFEDIFHDLGSYPLASNVARGGRQIPVSHQPESEISMFYANILEAHGIDPKIVAIPQPLKELAQLSGRELRKHGFAYTGQDWIMDKQGNYYFLEANPAPSFEIFNTLFFDGKGRRADYRALAIRKIVAAIRRLSP